MRVQNVVATSLGAAGTGAALMFFLDPARGNRRRAIVASKAAKLARNAGRTLTGTAQDVSNRTQGLAASVRSRFSNEPPPDEVLAERVRSKLGRIVSHPGSIDVSVRRGTVTLRGDVLRSEARDVVSRVSSIAGVENVRNFLRSRAEDGEMMERGRWRSGSRESHKAITKKRIALASAGVALALLGSRRGGVSGRIMAAAGAGLLGSELTDTKLNFLAHRLKQGLLAH